MTSEGIVDEPKSIGRNWTVVWTAVGSLGTVAAVIVAIIALDGGDNAASGGASETPQASLESSTSSSSPPESSSSSSSSPPPPPVPVEHTVPLKMLYDGSGTTTIGGQRFPYVAVGLHGAAVTVDDGT